MDTFSSDHGDILSNRKQAEGEFQRHTSSATETPQRTAHPFKTANILSKIFFWWMFSFLRRGYKKTLVEEDLFDVLPQDSSKTLVEQLESKWNKELEKSNKRGKSPSLVRALVKTFGWDFTVYGVPIFFENDIFKVAQPLLLSRLVLYFSTDLVSITEAYLLTTGIALCAASILVCHHLAFFGLSRLGMRLRVACSSLIYRKALTLSNLALDETTIGQLVNIMSNDVSKFDSAFQIIHYLWIGPVQILLIGGILWGEIGASCLAGLSILFLMVPIQAFMAKFFSQFRSQVASMSDERISTMSEVISGIRVIKIFAWEASFGRLVSEARGKEIRKIMQAGYVRAVPLTFFITAPLLIMMPTLWVYAALGNPVIPSKVYAILPLIYAARLCVGRFLPDAIINVAEGLVSIGRVKKFLLMEELIRAATSDEVTVPNIKVEGMSSGVHRNELTISTDINGAVVHDESHEQSDSESISSDSYNVEFIIPGDGTKTKLKAEINGAYVEDLYPDTMNQCRELNDVIVVENLNGSWTKDLNSSVLEGISFTVHPGELLAVTGPVGCGKSSLLMALLGELPSATGCRELRGRIGYAAQQPWILSGSLRDNILFGSDYHPARYRNVIKQCSLVRDIEFLEHGDETLVGERGVTLSGGQRARVSLARAVYSNADVYLLDDPLSAVDPAVGRYLFEKCILKYLKDKPKILVTHQLQFLDKADKILILEQGKITSYGTYHELKEHGVDFDAFLKKTPKEDDNVQEEEKTKPMRKISTVSVSSISSFFLDEFEDCESVDVAPEETAVGSVGYNVYLRYFRAGAGTLFLFFWGFICVGAQALFTFTEIWLSQWATVEEEYLAGRNLTSQDDFQSNVLEFEDQSYYITVFVILCGVTVFACFLRGFLFSYLFVTASKNLHNQMFDSVIRVPMQFFETNAVGRVLNRFAKDIGYMDELLPVAFTDVLQLSILTASVVIVISIFNPFCLVFTMPIVIIFVFVRRYFLASSRDIKRMEGNARSPVFSHLSETLIGLSTIRAFKAQERFTRDFDAYQDRHTEAWFLFLAMTRWFGIQLELMSVVFITCVCFTSVVGSDLLGLDSGTVGLTLTYAINLMSVFQWGVRQSAEVENQMTSVERVCQYIDMKPEAALETDNRPPPEWPKHGMITLEEASLKYSDDAPLVLKNINCCIRPKEKVGIVGRTGAGKSSLMTILMRLAEPTGTIMIDGINITEIGLHDLRKKISFIPQDPVLFSGTLRKNLDPFNSHSDPDLWRVLEEVELKVVVEELPDKLEAILTEGGTNFSVGQRQLLCLSRAILGKNKILTVDEATANVDIRTDRLIQATIRERFKHCTVLTVAHRLNTIMDSDRVMVLDAGRLVEFDEPYVLLQTDGLFTKMVKEMKRAEIDKLVEVARDKHLERNLCTRDSQTKRSEGRRTILIESCL